MQRLLEAIVTTFHNNGTLSAFQGLVSNASGPYYGVAPEGCQPPYTTLTTVGGLQNQQGFTGNYIANSQVQFSVFGEDNNTVQTNTEALCKVFDAMGYLSLSGGELCRRPVRMEEPRYIPQPIDGNAKRMYAGIAQYVFHVQRTRGS